MTLVIGIIVWAVLVGILVNYFNAKETENAKEMARKSPTLRIIKRKLALGEISIDESLRQSELADKV